MLSSADTDPWVMPTSKTEVTNTTKLEVLLDILRTLTKPSQLFAVSELVGEVNLA
jgi:hypothetical protein